MKEKDANDPNLCTYHTPRSHGLLTNLNDEESSKNTQPSCFSDF